MIERNEEFTLYFAMVDASDLETPIVVGVPVIMLAKEGLGTQVAAGNAASVVGTQWVVVLTAAEMNYPGVGVVITLAGAITVDRHLVTGGGNITFNQTDVR